MNTILVQELARFNKLNHAICTNLRNIIMGFEGTILLSKDDEEASQQMFMGKIPDLWKPWSYPSLKPVGSYIKDLKERIAFF